jgi:hypothetical protein
MATALSLLLQSIHNFRLGILKLKPDVNKVPV